MSGWRALHLHQRPGGVSNQRPGDVEGECEGFEVEALLERPLSAGLHDCMKLGNMVLRQSMLASTTSRRYDLIVLNSIPCFESGGSGVSDGESLRAAHSILSFIFLDLDLCVLSKAVNAKAISCHR